MPTFVIAQNGDCLCNLAIAAGFFDCQPIRDEPLNQGEDFLTRPLREGDLVTIPDRVTKHESKGADAKHTFVKKNAPAVSIRFVHGSPDKKYLDDFTLTELNVSNYVTDKGGADGTANFPSGFGFDQRGHEDEDSFKVEVIDPAAGGSVNVTLEALKPVHKPDGSIDHHVPFAGAERASRMLDPVQCKKVSSGVAYRSKYLRLVVDSVDKNDQTLLVTDVVDAGEPNVEILNQDVQATYMVPRCPAGGAGKCRVTAQAPLGRGKTVDLVARVLRGVPTGLIEKVEGGVGDDGIVKLADFRKRIQTFVRRYWAQAQVKPQILRLETVDLPSNMLTVADASGNLAQGQNAAASAPGVVGFTLRVQRFGKGADSVHVIAPIAIPAGNTPDQTASLLKAEIEKIVGLSATVSPNTAEIGQARGSVDVLVSEFFNSRVTITNLSSDADQDADQKVAISQLTMTVHFRNNADNYHVGHPEQRNLVKALDTGGGHIDIHAVNQVPGVRGFTVPERKDLNATAHPVSALKNSIIMSLIASDSTTNNPFSLPHEIGHILTDEGLHALPGTELMTGGGTSAASTAITDSKRIWGRESKVLNWQESFMQPDGHVGQRQQRLNAVARVHATSAGLLR